MSQPLHTQVFIGASGNRLVADVGGCPDAPAVMLLHGGGQTRHSWGKAQLELIEAGYHVLSVDARGHGESDWIADGDYSMASYVGDIRAIINVLGRKPALVGASLGGVNSLIACGNDPEIASALVLVDVTPRLEVEGIAHIHRFMTANLDGFPSIEAAGDAVAAYNPLRPRPRNLEGLRKNLRLRGDGRWYWHWDPNMLTLDRGVRLTQISEDMLSAANRIRIPTMLVRGKQSDVVSAQGVNELQQRIAHLEFTDIEGAGHMIAGDRNDAFNSAISEFLHRHLPLKPS